MPEDATSTLRQTLKFVLRALGAAGVPGASLAADAVDATADWLDQRRAWDDLHAALQRAETQFRALARQQGWSDLADAILQLPVHNLPAFEVAVRAALAGGDPAPLEEHLRVALADLPGAAPDLAARAAQRYASLVLEALWAVPAFRDAVRDVLFRQQTQALARLEAQMQALHADLIPFLAALEDLRDAIITPLRRLRVDYATRIEEFLRAYLGTPDKPVPFGGREAQLATLDAWLDDADTTHLLLTAPAGRGKSALLVRWLQWVRQARPELNIAFVPVSIRYGTNLATVTFAALAAQLARAFGEEVPTEHNASAEVWQDMVAHYLRREPPPGGLLVVVDGVDEAADWDARPGLFPSELPRGTHLVVSARLTADRPQAVDWRDALGWEFARVRLLDLPPLDREGLRDVLVKMGAPVDELARKPFIVEELHRLTEGDPLLVRFYVEDLWGQGEAVRRLKPEDLRSLEPGYEGYIERWWEDQERLWEQKGQGRESQKEHVQKVLDVLSVALGPLTLSELRHLTHLHSRVLRNALKILARFVIESPEGYIFSHPKLNEYFLLPEERSEIETKFLIWGNEVLTALEQGALAPKKAPPYVVRYYRAHLERAGAGLAAFRCLVHTDAWARAWEALEGAYSGYLSDVNAVWRQATQTNEAALAGRSTAAPLPADDCRLPTVGLELRCALIEASIHSLAGNLPPELPALLVANGLWTPTQALAHVHQMPDDEKRVKALAVLAPHLPEGQRAQALAEALDAARGIEDEQYRAEALAGLAPHLPEGLLAEALAAVRRIGGAEARARALVALALHLPKFHQEPILAEALSAVQTLPQRNALGLSPKAHALMEISPYLPERLRAEAIATARRIENANDRLDALVALIPYLSEEERERVLAEALKAAWGLEDAWSRTRVLTNLLPYLPDGKRKQSLVEMLAVAQRIQGTEARIFALAALTPYLTQVLREQVLAEALTAFREEIEKADARARALTVLAPHLSEDFLVEALAITQALPEQDSLGLHNPRAEALVGLAPYLSAMLLVKALAITREMENARARAEALVGLASHLPKELREQALIEALEAAQEIRDSEARARALAALAPHLPVNLLAEALAAARGIQKEWARAEVLTVLAPYLPQNLLAEVLTAAREIEWEGDRARTLAGLAPHLPEALRAQALGEALVAAQGIERPRYRVEVLTALASHLPEEQRTQVLGAALDAARGIEDERYRAEALAALAPRLPEEQRAQALTEALDVAREIERDWARAEALAALAPYLPEELLAEALASARGIEWKRYRAEALAALAPRLPAEQRFQALAEALDAARALPEEDILGGSPRAEALAVLAPHLPEEQRAQALVEALAAAREIEWAWARAKVLTALALYLPEAQQAKALAEALHATREIRDADARAYALTALALHLPANLLAETLATAREIEWKRYRAKALAALAPRLAELPLQALYPLWRDTLPILARRTRQDLLADIRALHPVIAKLGGAEALRETAQAIVDVTRWWP